MLYQQGDVLFESTKIPKDAKRKPGGLVAQGEATGHAHTLELIDGVELMEDEQGGLFTKADKPATVNHQEHRTITLPPGQYCIRRVREYDHFAEEARQVKD